jgi:hypothetical protein
MQATAHPALIPQEAPGSSRTHPRIPAARNHQDRPVTPEVAGSSPVAPVKIPCKSAYCVVGLDARSAPTTQTLLDATTKQPKTGRFPWRGDDFKPIQGGFGLTANAASDYTE